MLQFIRDKAQSIVIQGIVVIIALVFIFWGVGTNLNNKQEAAIVVNGEEISFQQFQQAYDQAYTRLGQQFGGTVPKGLAETLNIRQQVISQLTQEALLRQGGSAMGIVVSGKEVQKEVEGMVQFQDNGGFDLERYKTILASNRMSPKKFEQSLRVDLLGNNTISNLSDFALPASDFQVEDLYNLEKETVSVSYAAISPETLISNIEVSDEDLEQWYQASGERYKTEVMTQLTYLPFSYKDIGAKITIDDAAIQDYYDQHLTEYQTPEKRHARHILFKAGTEDSDETHEQQRLKAEDIQKKAIGGEDFATLAEEYSEGPTAVAGGELGFFSQGQMVKPFNDAVFAMQESEISNVVKTDFGYHIIKLEEIQLSGVRTMEEVRAEIATKLQMDQAKPLTFQVANEAYENIIGSGSLAAYLQAHPETKVVETEFFSRSAPPPGMTTDPSFQQRAFALKPGELSSLLETTAGYAIISATAIKDPQVPDLNKVKEQATADYKTEKTRNKALAIAEQLIDDLNNKEGVSFEELTQAAGLTLQQSGPLTKSNQKQESSFPQPLVQSVFRLSSSSPIPGEPGLVGQDYYVYRFIERKPPETAMSDSDRKRYRELMLQFKQQQILDSWLQSQQDQADIFINKSLQNF